MRRLLVVLVLLAVTALPSAAALASARPHATPRLEVLVVAGQSNAMGYQSYVVDPKTHHDVFNDRAAAAADKDVLLTWDESWVPSTATTPVALDTRQRLTGAPSPILDPRWASPGTSSPRARHCSS